MKTNTKILRASTVYHIYNRGINSDTIFSEEKNYAYFLSLYSKYIPQIADTYAYCLLGNHFHFLIKTKSEHEIISAFQTTKERKKFLKYDEATYHISNQFSKLFNSYVQAYNKMYKRTGALLENPFRRIEVDNNRYFTALVYYIHSNPAKHGICNDFTQYQHSSYSAYIIEKKTQLKKDEVFDWFDNKDEFVKFHSKYHSTSKLLNNHLEIDF